MKKIIRFFSMAALALVGAVMTGCSSDDNTVSTPQSNNGLVLKTTVSLDGGASTRSLTAGGVKTFAVGDQIVVFYKDGKGQSLRVLSDALTIDDIHNDGKSADFTVTFLNIPGDDAQLRYVYPVNMAKESITTSAEINDANTIDFTQLDDQKGTLDVLGRALDLATFDGNFSGTSLPASATLTNQLAVLAITLTDNAAEPADITSSITDLIVTEGSNHYAVTRAAAAGPIYVAIKPTSSAVIEIAATDGANEYGKFLTSKTYAANNGYNVSWKMLPCVRLSALGNSVFDVTEDMILTGTPAAYLTIVNNDGYTVTLDNVNPEGTATVTMNCGSDFTLKLKGTSKFTRIFDIGHALTIGEAVAGGTVIINNSTYALRAATVTVNGGTVKAKSTASNYAVGGNLEVNGGAVYLAGADGYNAVSGTITGTLYGWGGTAWGAATGVQYVTTDNTSGDPTAWTW